MNKIKLTLVNNLGLKVKGEISIMSKDKIVVFAHGFGGFMKDPQFQFYKEMLLLNNYSVCLFDFTNGIGESERSRKIAFAYNDLKDELSLVLNELHLMGYSQIYIIAHSLGGALALDIAGDNRYSIKALALVNPLINNNFSFELVENDFKITYQKHQSTFSNIFRLLPNFSKIIFDIKNLDLRSKISINKVPTIVILGRYDKVVKFSENKKMFLSSPENYFMKEYDFPHTFWSIKNRKMLPLVSTDIVNFFNKY